FLVLVIEPTVGAHWPFAMTHLTVALLSATAIVLAARAFRDWSWPDLAACSLFLGLALAAKHSAPVVLVIVTTVGVCVALWQPAMPSSLVRTQKLLKIVAVVAGALVVMWGAYFFRYSESP